MLGHRYVDAFQPPATRRPNTAPPSKGDPIHRDSNAPPPVKPSPGGQVVNGFVENHPQEKPAVHGVPSKDVAATYKSHMTSLQESHSPKQLTCEPPTFGLHKPLPKAASTTSVPSDSGPHNYENHDEMEGVVQEARSGTSQSDTLEWAGKKSEKHQFPFVSWLKREPGNRNNSGDSKSSADSPYQGADRHPVSTPVATTFSKFKNSMVQRFSHSPSTPAKRTAEVAGLQENTDTSHSQPTATVSAYTPSNSQPTTSVSSYMPLNVVVSENEITPYVTSMGRDSRQVAARYHESRKYATQPGGSSARDYRTSSAERRNMFDSRFMTTGGGKIRTGSNVSTEYAGLYHTPPFHAPIDKDGYSSPNIIATAFEKGDINNNTTPKNANPESHGVVRTRAPLLLGSNVSISDAYPPNERDTAPHMSSRQPVFEQGVIRKTEKPTHAFQHIPASVPSYSAKRIHNYENQGRLETAVKQRADPVTFPSSPLSDLPASSHMNTYPLGGRSTLASANSQNYPSTTQSTPATDMAYHRLHESLMQVNTPVSSTRQPPVKPSRNLHLNFTPESRRDEKKFAASLDRLDRNGHSAPSISTLINRFEKKQNLLEAVNNEEKSLAKDVGKSLGMTSTPVTYKMPPGVDSDDKDPPPVPPRSDHSFTENYPSDSLESQSSRGKGRKSLPLLDNTNTFNFDSSGSHTQMYTPFAESAPSLLHSGTSNHVRQETGSSDQDDGYRERLRKVAASSTVLERYSKHMTPQYQKQGNPVQFSTPQYSRQNSQTSVMPLSSTQTYSRQNSATTSQPTPQFSRTNGNVLTVTNKLGTTHSQFQNHVSPSQPQIPQPQFAKDSNLQQHSDSRHTASAMAVVQPTMVHHGSVSFMEI